MQTGERYNVATLRLNKTQRMLRQLINLVILSTIMAACAQAAPTAVPTRLESVPTSARPTPITFPTAIPEETLTPSATAQSVFPSVTDEDWQKGPATARVTILEYGDFQ